MFCSLASFLLTEGLTEGLPEGLYCMFFFFPNFFQRQHKTLKQGKIESHLIATLATKEESRPPDSRTPKGASDISRFTTALMKLCCSQHKTVKSLSQCARCCIVSTVVHS